MAKRCLHRPRIKIRLGKREPPGLRRQASLLSRKKSNLKIRHFKGVRLHGYLNFDFAFNPDITFLTGINGSGKTTVVRSIFALISPSLSILGRTVFERVEVQLEHENRQVRVWATRNDKFLSLGTSETTMALEVALPGDRRLVVDPDEERDYYQDQMARNVGHPVAQFLNQLPTPMFLSIERRVTQSWVEGVSPQRFVHWRQGREVFHSLATSLTEAATLAQQKFNQVQAKLRELADYLRKQIILAALQYQPAFKPAEQELMQTLDLNTITSNVDAIKATLGQLGLSGADIESQLTPFLNRLVELSAYFPFTEKIGELPEEPGRLLAFIEWTINRPQVDRLMLILQHVNKYIAKTDVARKPLTQYLDIVNRFFSDSGKELSFSKTGQLQVTMPGAAVRPITSLSSGESQLVVILTHLAFNPAAQSANVFIIDEPELSLHVRWQELFVEAIRGVNPQMQTILATHSPAIILDDVRHCVDLGELVPQ